MIEYLGDSQAVLLAEQHIQVRGAGTMDSVEILIDNARRLDVPLLKLCDEWGWNGKWESDVGFLGQPDLVSSIVGLREKLTDMNNGRLACTRLVRAYAEMKGLPEKAVDYLVHIAQVMGFDDHYNCACTYNARRKWSGQ